MKVAVEDVLPPVPLELLLFVTALDGAAAPPHETSPIASTTVFCGIVGVRKGTDNPLFA
jgi:hypothetical protein